MTGCLTALVFDNVTSVTGYPTDFAFCNPTCITEGLQLVTVNNGTPMAQVFQWIMFPV